MSAATENGGHTFTYHADKTVTALLPLKKTDGQSVSRIFRSPVGRLEEPVHIASGHYRDLFIMPQAESYKEFPCHVTCGFSVWVKHKENGDRYQEKRTLDFVFHDDIPNAVRHSVAEDYFIRLTATSGRDAVEFLMNALMLFRDLPNNYIRHVDVKVERVSDDEVVVVPASKDCESDGEVEDLLAGHVQTVLEFAYPNALAFDSIVEALRTTPDLVSTYLGELVEKGIVEQLESGEYIRVNNFAKSIENKLHKTERPPTIAIITSLFLENLAVINTIKDATTIHMYNLNGDANIYTIGNIGEHRVVVTKLSMIGDSREATTSAGSITTRLLGNFQEVEHVLVVGVGGGVPHFTNPEQHVRLGDVVMSSTQSGKNPAYVYGSDVVKDRTTGRVIGLTPHKWSPKEETFIELLHKRGAEIQKSWPAYAEDLITRLNDAKMENLDFTRPPADVDVIAVDSGDGDAVVAAHPNANRLHPVAHEGTIASMLRYAPPISLDDSDVPIRQPNAQSLRNGFLHEYGAKAFDAGFDSVIASVVGNCINSYVLVRGIADYYNGSSRVARQWQPYAAANAAALAKTLIEMLPQ